MMSGVLLIGEDEKAALVAAREKARACPRSLEDLQRLGVNKAPDDDGLLTLSLEDRKGKEQFVVPPGEQVHLPVGYRVSISFEIQPEPVGLCAHISMSTSTPGKVPRPESLAMVVSALGLRWPPLTVWLEEFLEDGKLGGKAVNGLFLEQGKGADQ